MPRRTTGRSHDPRRATRPRRRRATGMSRRRGARARRRGRSARPGRWPPARRAAAARRSHPRPRLPGRPAGTTLARTLLHGTPGATGYRQVVAGPGEPSLVRADLLGGGDARDGTPAARCWRSASSPTCTSSTRSRPPASSSSTARRPRPAAARRSCRSSPPTARRRCSPRTSPRRWCRRSTRYRRPGDAAARSTSRSAPATTPTTPSSTRCAGRSTLLDGGSGPPRLGRLPPKWEGVGGPDDHDPQLLAPGRHAARRQARQLPQRLYGFPTVPGLLDRVPQAVHRHRPDHALVHASSATTTGWCRAPSRRSESINAIAIGVGEGHRPRPERRPHRRPGRAGRRRLQRRWSTCSPPARPRSSPPTEPPLLTRTQTVRGALHAPPARRSATATRSSNLDNGTAYYSFDPARRCALHLAGHLQPQRLRRRLARHARSCLAAAELNANSSRYLDTDRQLGRPAPAPTSSS